MNQSTLNDNVVFRKSSHNDIAAVNKLFSDVFPDSRDRDYWEWWYHNNPRGSGWASLAFLENNLVGHVGFARKDLNLNGQVVTAGHATDAMIASGLRGQNIFTRLTNYNLEFAERQGVQAEIVFPSRNSWPSSYSLIMKRLGYIRVANLHHYKARLGLRRFLWVTDPVLRGMLRTVRRGRNAIYSRSSNQGLYIEHCDSVPEEFQEGLQQIMNYEVLSVFKDISYLKWRYEDHPTNRYLFHILKSEDGIHGLVVSRDDSPVINLCEVLHRRKDIDQTAFLLRAVMNYYSRRGCQLIQFYGYDNGFFDAGFEAAGFEIRPFSKIILCVKLMENSKLNNYAINSNNWSIAYGDTDDA